MKKKHCIGDCDFKSYYLKQVGGGFEDINIFRGSPYQRGYGIGSLFKRFGIPLAKFIGKHLLKTGLAVGSDILVNNSFDKNVTKEKLREGLKHAVSEGLDSAREYAKQRGYGIKRKASKRKKIVYKRKKSAKKQKKDIFG